ncbi:hypothetical protein B0O99DRAFT_268484 [Bisporella sp. PMI_857]|nr:hypothetical protein B0O99DRAFT_268484 [Bisporella sp. PMI_857]
MSYNQDSVYKYGRGQTQAAHTNSITVVARPFIPTSHIRQTDRQRSSGFSNMSGDGGNPKVEYTPEQIREFRERKLRTEKAGLLADFFGVARDVDQEEWGEQERNMKACGAESSNKHETLKRQNSGNIRYKSAQILDPATGQVIEVTVIEDSACQSNFISPEVARLCNLDLHPTPSIEHTTLKGSFISDLWTQITWIGKNCIKGSDWFYVAPTEAPIDLLVGTRFLRDHPDVFNDSVLPIPALLNVQKRIKASW